MKKVNLILAALTLGAASLPALAAGPIESPFSVTAKLTSACILGTGAADVDFGTYTAFQAAPITKTTSVMVKCTRGIAVPKVQLDTGDGLTAAGLPAGSASGMGELAGLQYTLAVAAGQKSVTGAAENGSGNGTADEYTFDITAEIPGNQAGTDTPLAVSQARRVFVTY